MKSDQYQKSGKMELKNLKVLITGGAGFIGSHLADRLLELDNSVIVYDNFDPYYKGKRRNIEHNLKNLHYELVKGDILDYERLKEAMKDVNVVFHLAAQPGVRYSMSNPVKVNTVNATGTINVLRAVRENDVDKLVYASSSSVYGNVQKLPMSEENPAEPISPYGVSKLAAEHYCRTYCQTYGLDVVTLRYFTVIGGRQRPDMAVHIFARRMLDDQEILIFGDGEQTRDFTNVHDVVQGTILAAETEGIKGEVFNIGSGRRTSLNELVKLLAETIGKKARIKHTEAKQGDVRNTLADITKARTTLGYNPKVSLKDSLNEFVE